MKNCVLKVVSTGLNINNEVSKLISNEFLVSSENGKWYFYYYTKWSYHTSDLNLQISKAKRTRFILNF